MSKHPGKIVIVEWIDAHTTELDEILPEDIGDKLHYGYHTVSVGHLCQSDEKGISLASDRQEGQDNIHYRCAHFIPRGMVVRETVIPEPNKKAIRARKPLKTPKQIVKAIKELSPEAEDARKHCG